MSKHPHQHDHAKPHPYKPSGTRQGHAPAGPQPDAPPPSEASPPPGTHSQPPAAPGPQSTAHGESPVGHAAPEHKPKAAPTPVETSGCAMRLLWMFVGNGVLGVSAIEIGKSHEGFWSLADLVFWLTVPALIALRYVDITRFKGTTAAGAPATLAHWRRYVMILIPAAIILWAAAHGMERLLR